MKIAAISDLHGTLPTIEKCDVCLIAGDIIPLDIQNIKAASIAWLFKHFLAWIKDLPCNNVYMVAGNHDKIAEVDYPVMKALEYLSNFKLTYMLNTSETITLEDGEDVNIYGSPQCHTFGSWSFMYDESYLLDLYSKVPKQTDIWLTHDTPKLGDLDLLPPSRWNPNSEHAGGWCLANAILNIKPRLVICGHLHTCKEKVLKIDNTLICNVSILDNEYNHVYEPTYIEYTSNNIKIIN